MKVSRRFVFLAIAATILSSCGPAPRVSTPSSTTPNAPTATAARSSTPAVPSKIQTPEPTQTPPLPSSGPYFAFLTQKDDGSILTLLGANSTGRKDISLPVSDRTGNCPACVISPDGQWLAYWTGSAGEINYSNQLDPNGHYDLQLNLLHISDGTTTVVTGLLSPDYPANFTKNAEAIKNQTQFAGMDVPAITNVLQMSFVWGIESAAWSPDNRYLAFAGEMDGPSSDLYVYDMSQKSILRLSSGGANIIANGDPAIGWSPDGKWIVYTSAYFVGEGMTLTYYAARPDGSLFRDFKEDVSGGLEEWSSPSAFLTFNGANGIGSYGIRINDLETGRSSEIWQCPFDIFRYDPEEGFYIVISHSSSLLENCQKDGLYFGFPSSTPARLLFRADEINRSPWIGFLGQGERRFLVYLDTGAFVVSSTGEKTLIGDAGLSPSISPDRRWVAFAGKGLRVMDASGKISGPLTDIQAANVNWRPDSQGFLFASGPDLFSVSLPDETVTQMDGINYPSDASNIHWEPDSQGYFFTSGSTLYFLSFGEKSVTLVQEISSPNSFDPVWVAIPG